MIRANHGIAVPASIRYHPPHELPAMTVEELCQQAEAVLRRDALNGFNLEKAKQAVRSLFQSPQMHDYCRPLYAAFAAEAIQLGGAAAVTNWGHDKLESFILDRELTYWRSDGIDDPHVNALVLATIVGGRIIRCAGPIAGIGCLGGPGITCR